MLKVTFDDRRWSSQNARPDCLAALEGITPYAGLDATGFALVETGEDSGVFEGSFRIPSHWCRPGSEYPEAVAGLDPGVNCTDFRDACGQGGAGGHRRGHIAGGFRLRTRGGRRV